MMRPEKLFALRLRYSWKEQLRAWSSVMDWTVWLYIAVPALFIGGGLYRELWLDMPDWATQFPWGILHPLLMLLAIALGRIRVPLEEADRLFLRQQEHWLRALRRCGVWYSFGMQTLPIVLVTGLLLPFLLHAEGMRGSGIALAALYSFVFGMLMPMLLHIAAAQRRVWQRRLTAVAGLTALAAAYLYPMLALKPDWTWPFLTALAAALLAIPVLLWLTLRAGIAFEKEVRRERRTRSASTEIIMSRAMERQEAPTFRRPWLFLRSGRLFRATDAGTLLAEMRIKAFLRSSSLRVLAGFVSICSYAITKVPPSAAFALMIAFVAMGASWLRLQWQQWYEEEFVAQFPWQAKEAERAIRLSRFWLLLPAVLVWSAIGGYGLLGWWGAAAAPAVCAAVWLLASRYEWGARRSRDAGD